MASPHFTPTGKPKTSITAFSKEIRVLLDAIETAMAVMNEYALCIYVPDGKVSEQTRILIPFNGIIKRIHMVNGAAMSGTGMSLQVWANGLLDTSTWASADPADTVQVIDDVPVDAISTMTVGQDIMIQGFVNAGGVNPTHIVIIMERT